MKGVFTVFLVPFCGYFLRPALSSNVTDNGHGKR
jgi:hypothetical protein